MPAISVELVTHVFKKTLENTIVLKAWFCVGRIVAAEDVCVWRWQWLVAGGKDGAAGCPWASSAGVTSLHFGGEVQSVSPFPGALWPAGWGELETPGPVIPLRVSWQPVKCQGDSTCTVLHCFSSGRGQSFSWAFICFAPSLFQVELWMELPPGYAPEMLGCPAAFLCVQWGWYCPGNPAWGAGQYF